MPPTTINQEDFYGNKHLKGILCCLFGILILSPDTLLLRLVESIPNYVVLFYRFASYFIGSFAVLLYNDGFNIWNRLKFHGVLGYGMGILWGIQTLSFAIGIQNSPVASALVINASSPLFAALFEFLLLGIRPKMRTIATAIVAIGSIVLIFSGINKSGDKNLGGLFASLVSSISMGLYFSLVAFVSKPKPVPLEPTIPIRSNSDVSDSTAMNESPIEYKMLFCNVIQGLFGMLGTQIFTFSVIYMKG